MNKMIKRVFAGAMAAAVVLGGVAASPVSVKAEDSYNVYLMYADASWLWDNWDSSVANASVTGDGTYTVTLNAADAADTGTTDAAAGVVVFCVDIEGINNPDIVLDDIHIYTDGTEISCDSSLLFTGDIEENGNWRIEIYNEYGLGTATNSPIDADSFTWSESLSVTFTISNTGLTSGDDSTGDDSTTDDSAADDSTTDDSTTDGSTTDDSSSDDTTSNDTTGDDTTSTGDVAPIAAVAVLLAGCVLVFAASKKRMA